MLFGGRLKFRAAVLPEYRPVSGRGMTPSLTRGDMGDSVPAVAAGQYAEAYFDRGYNCAQSVLMAASDALGVNVPPEMVRGMAAFTGGIGYSGCTCGALVGASAFAGMLAADESWPRRNKRATDVGAKLHDAFKERYKTTCCRALRKGRDFHDRESRADCREITASTAELLVGIIETAKVRGKSGRVSR